MKNSEKLLQTLEQNGLTQEREEVLALMDYLRTTEQTLSQMTLTLQTMQNEIQGIHDRSLRGRCEKIVSDAGEKVQQAKEAAASAGSGLRQGAENALAAFREKGREGLIRAAGAMKIPQALTGLQSGFHQAALSMGEAAGKVEALRQQIHESGGFLRNAGRALLGRPVQETPALAADRGALAKARDLFQHMEQSFSGMEHGAGTLLERLEPTAAREALTSGQEAEDAQPTEPETVEQTLDDEFSDMDPAAVREALQNPNQAHVNEMLAFAAQAEQEYAAQAAAFEQTPADIVEQAQEVQAAWEQVVGYCFWPAQEVKIAYTNPMAYVSTVEQELDNYMQTGFRYETVTRDPAVRKAVDDAVYNLFGLNNPHDLDYYSQQAEAGERNTQSAESSWQADGDAGQPAPEAEPEDIPEMEL